MLIAGVVVALSEGRQMTYVVVLIILLNGVAFFTIDFIGFLVRSAKGAPAVEQLNGAGSMI
jgi:hypothetical protein